MMWTFRVATNTNIDLLFAGSYTLLQKKICFPLKKNTHKKKKVNKEKLFDRFNIHDVYSRSSKYILFIIFHTLPLYISAIVILYVHGSITLVHHWIFLTYISANNINNAKYINVNIFLCKHKLHFIVTTYKKKRKKRDKQTLKSPTFFLYYSSVHYSYTSIQVC
jgi:hypothetical protein